MWRFALRENIAHLRLLISKLDDHSKLPQLQAQLEQAELELAELEALSAHAEAAHDWAFSELLTDILREELRRDSANFGLVQLLEASSGSLQIAAQLNFQTDFLRHFEVVRADDGSVYGKALSDADGVWVEDVETADFFAQHLPFALAAGFRAVKSLPLSRSTGHVFGVFSLHFAQPQSWSAQHRSDDLRNVRNVARSVLAIRPAL